MVNFYFKRVAIYKVKKWTDVPELWKQAVIDKLKAEGYTLNDDGTVTKEAG